MGRDRTARIITDPAAKAGAGRSGRLNAGRASCCGSTAARAAAAIEAAEAEEAEAGGDGGGGDRGGADRGGGGDSGAMGSTFPQLTDPARRGRAVTVTQKRETLALCLSRKVLFALGGGEDAAVEVHLRRCYVGVGCISVSHVT